MRLSKFVSIVRRIHSTIYGTMHWNRALCTHHADKRQGLRMDRDPLAVLPFVWDDITGSVLMAGLFKMSKCVQTISISRCQ